MNLSKTAFCVGVFLTCNVALLGQIGGKLPGDALSPEELLNTYAAGSYGDDCFAQSACVGSAGGATLDCGVARLTPDPTDPAATQECFNGVVNVIGMACADCTGAVNSECDWCWYGSGCTTCTDSVGKLCCTRPACALVVAAVSTCTWADSRFVGIIRQVPV